MKSIHSDAETLALSISKKYGFNQCLPCATELRQVFVLNGKKGCVLQLGTKGGRGYIVMKDLSFILPFQAPASAAISDNGQHFGVQVGDFVFDNIHRTGVRRSEWEESFDCDVHRFKLTEIEHF